MKVRCCFCRAENEVEPECQAYSLCRRCKLPLRDAGRPGAEEAPPWASPHRGFARLLLVFGILSEGSGVLLLLVLLRERGDTGGLWLLFTVLIFSGIVFFSLRHIILTLAEIARNSWSAARELEETSKGDEK